MKVVNRIKYFRPLALVVTLAVIYTLCKLGAWQLQRADEKAQMIQLQQDMQNLPMTQWHRVLETLNNPTSDLLYADLRGLLAAEQVWYLDNAVVNGKVGYDVVSVFKPMPGVFPQTDNAAQGLIVNLGWIAAPTSRAQMPQVNLPIEPVSLQGVFNLKSSKPFILNSDYVDIPNRIQYIDIEQISSASQTPLATAVLHVTNTEEFGFKHHYKVINMSPDKHRAYALQWFSLALAAALVFIYASVKIGRRAPQGVKEK